MKPRRRIRFARPWDQKRRAPQSCSETRIFNAFWGIIAAQEWRTLKYNWSTKSEEHDFAACDEDQTIMFKKGWQRVRDMDIRELQKVLLLQSGVRLLHSLSTYLQKSDNRLQKFLCRSICTLYRLLQSVSNFCNPVPTSAKFKTYWSSLFRVFLLNIICSSYHFGAVVAWRSVPNHSGFSSMKCA
jgi:hypothetical protein